ncbi:unnamed protein product [Rotaria magnacalcarata]|uniref:RBR-type E3 ubiquitin transferase n=1 Tax=Rotaria magnacalcarata TaxID=392030 RepID=A0A819N0M3_9BILA|nr:unnamed protein product [Rotaria magnacalcarata]CAF2026201.1 unnamed protein product [Rotaria magnacalcarata]CAF3856727.1 unnamed protein product [Rotaria magnacalcarata]CAF3989245.1 unnamed protein product [Rotaria magnacalcarata]
MYAGEASSSNTRKHHRIHPIDERNSPTNENRKAHTILTISSSDDISPSQDTYPRSYSQASNSTTSSIDIRASDVIKRITSPSSTISTNDEILPQTFFRRMSASLNMNSFVQMAAVQTSTLPAIHDLNSTTNKNDETYSHSMITTITNINTNANECEICYLTNDCENLRSCEHNFCHSCLQIYLIDKIRLGCPALLECPHNECKEVLHPSDIKRILNDQQMYERYETFMLRRVLQKMPDTKWCPYPNCNFAVLVENTRKASKFDCLVCKRPFCQRCSQIWHPSSTCERASAQRATQDPTLEMLMKSSANGGSIRSCPRCKSPIEKLDDGSCNHIRCAICTCEFCWLCMKEVDNLHFITPTGCTFYGQKRWSKFKSIIFLLLSWILTPILAILIIVLAVPLLLLILPIIITKKFYRYSLDTNVDLMARVFLCIFVFMSAVILTPLILTFGLLIGIPLIIFFIYFYMPRRYVSANF